VKTKDLTPYVYARLKEHGGNVGQLAKSLGIQVSDLVDFSSNINPYGPPEAVTEAVRLAVDVIDEYPEQQAESFVGAVAQSLGIESRNIVAGNGTIELIYLIPQAFKAERALLVVPSFTEYELSLRKAGANIVCKEALTGEDVLRSIDGRPQEYDIAIIGNPNNPCGYRIDKDSLIEIIEGHPGCLWVIDEAFIDFTINGDGSSLVRPAAENDNLIVLRSLTKIYSVAGLRLGYMVSSPGTAAKVREEKYPWSINSIALAAGVAALKESEFVDWSVKLLSDEAQRFFKELSKVEWLTPYEPSANYILVKIESEMTASSLQEELLSRGIAIRDCSSYTGMDEKHFRVAVKRPQDNDRLLSILREL